MTRLSAFFPFFDYMCFSFLVCLDILFNVFSEHSLSAVPSFVKYAFEYACAGMCLEYACASMCLTVCAQDTKTFLHKLEWESPFRNFSEESFQIPTICFWRHVTIERISDNRNGRNLRRISVYLTRFV